MTGIIATAVAISSIPTIGKGLLKLGSQIYNSTSTGADKMESYLIETDLENKIATINLFINVLKLEKTSAVVQHCIEAIESTITDIKNELMKTQYRMKYNDSLYFATSIRAYRFWTTKNRLVGLVHILDQRFDSLIQILKIDIK